MCNTKYCFYSICATSDIDKSCQNIFPRKSTYFFGENIIGAIRRSANS